MMTRPTYLLLSLMLFSAACAHDPTLNDGEEQNKERERQTQITELAQSSKGFAQPLRRSDTLLLNKFLGRKRVQMNSVEGRLLFHTETRRDIEKLDVDDDDFFTSYSTNTQIWPGNLVQGGDILYNKLSPVPLEQFRKPVSLVLPVVNGSGGDKYRNNVAPTPSAVIAAANELLASEFDVGGEFPAEINFSCEELHSYEEAMSFAGIIDEKIDKGLKRVSWEKSDEKVFFLGILNQAFYTIKCDARASWSDLFNVSFANSRNDKRL